MNPTRSRVSSDPRLSDGSGTMSRGSERGPRILVASHQLPLAMERSGVRGAWGTRFTGGGLMSAMRPVLRARGGVWVGWPGVCREDGPPPGEPMQGEDGYALRPVSLSAGEIRGYDVGFASQVLWPVFHGLPDHSLIEPAYWPTYERVNRKFAAEIAAVHQEGDLVWVHDYHLFRVGRELKALGVAKGVSFFLHTPFPPPELFFRIPWAEQILDALADYDLVGFQTNRHVANFLACLRRLDPNPELGTGPAVTIGATLGGRHRTFRVGAFPIGIDFYELASDAAESAVAERVAMVRSRMGERKLLLGVDRLDYTKGVRHKLKAFAALLTRHPEWERKVELLQVVIPSREGIPAYDQLKADIEGLVGEINGRFSRPGWIPIHYRYRSLEPQELLVHYRLADVAVVTPLEDGMNLVAKEYCAANVDESGVLVLSRFAGAASQLADGAVLVNPWDEVGFADTLDRALRLDAAERHQRMERLRATVRNEDVFHWAGSFLKAALATLPSASPAASLPLPH